MNDVGRMNGAESPADLPREAVYLRRWKGVHPAEKLGEALAVYPIHGNQGITAHLTNIVNADYVLIANPRCQNEFSLESQQVAQIWNQFGTQYFHCDGAIQRPIQGAVDGAHTAGAHLLLQIRTRILNNDLADDFHRWYPDLSVRAQNAAA